MNSDGGRMMIAIPARPIRDDESRPRSTAVRFLLAALMWTVAIGTPLVVDRLIHRLIVREEVGYWMVALPDLVILIPIIPLACAARSVSYRVRDSLIYIILPLGLLLSFRIFWRVAFLPYRDWQPRPDEIQSWERIENSGTKRKTYKRKCS